MTKELSKCCKAKTIVRGDTTKYYICSKCKKACNLSDNMERQKNVFDTWYLIEQVLGIDYDTVKRWKINKIVQRATDEAFKQGKEKQKADIKMLITKEINIANSEGQRTSRLTSLWNKLK